MKVKRFLIASSLFLTAVGAAAAPSQENEKPSCQSPFDSVQCLSELPVPEGLPPTVKAEEFRSYAQRLQSLSEELPDTVREIQKLKGLPFAAAGKIQLEKALKLTASILSDVEQAKAEIDSFADLQYFASRASLDASRVGNAMAELRLSVQPSPYAAQVFEFLQLQMDTFDVLSRELMPVWLQ